MIPYILAILLRGLSKRPTRARTMPTAGRAAYFQARLFLADAFLDARRVSARSPPFHARRRAHRLIYRPRLLD